MKPVLQEPSAWVGVVAFLRRAFGRSLGIYRPGPFGEDIPRRAKRYVNLLAYDEAGLAFQVALDDLRFDSDLLDEAAALVPEGLELQQRVFELAGRYCAAERLFARAIADPPISRLFGAIILQTVEQGATQVQIDLRSDRKTIPVIIGGVEEIFIPTTLGPPLRGVIARVEAIGYSAVAPWFKLKSPLPPRVRIEWKTAGLVEFTIEQ